MSSVYGAATQRTYLVIGGGGFLGKKICEALLERGENHVRIFDIRKTWEDSRIEKFFVADLTKLSDVVEACRGIDTIIHTASPPHSVGYQVYFKVNVEGTKNVIAACLENNVKRLVYTSSSSVVFDGSHLRGVDETKPYCKKHLDPYNHTKVIAKTLAQQKKKGGKI